MAVEQRADDAAAQHAFKRLVFLARLPLGDDLIAIRKAAHVQTFRIRRPTTKAREIRRVSFLNAFHWAMYSRLGSVPPAVAGGYHLMSGSLVYVDPPATAGGTDPRRE